ncbi:MAG TPA: alpha-amylase family glycosyl hydrolase [Anaerolineaceae bacterium]|nr:alpha-amylase family glycosyl hydrolase [Anaerolineaceae bacterium]
MFRKSIYPLIALSLLLSLFNFQEASPVSAHPTAPQGAADCNIMWNDVLHDSFDPVYRSPGGAVTPGGTVRLRLRVAQSDLTTARVRVWNDRTNTETYYSMSWDGAYDIDPTTYDWWFVNIPIPSDPTVLYYFFEMNDAGGSCSPADQDFYTDDDPRFYGGGYGAMSDNYNDSKSFQITVYDPAFDVPEWLQRGVIYQIFPDRFRDGDPSNNPQSGRFFYNEAGGAIVRSGTSVWNTAICDPRAGTCPGKYSSNFYGGDLQGITDKINAGYFDNLGITVLYFNPIFRSPSNHKYDTADYLVIDPDFGTLADFQELAAAAEAHGMTLILDGVFNHVSSDSTYFDRYHRYDAAGNLTSPTGPGTDDNSGACESPSSAFRGWFYLPDTLGSPAMDEGGVTAYCTTTDGSPDTLSTSYSAWWGYSSLPKLQATITAIKNLIWNNGAASVGPYWVNQGASGWRLDVGGDVDPGLTNDPANTYWEGFRAAVRAINPQTAVIGEEWGDATAWLLGNEWDSVMNYRYRSAILSWLFTSCSGNGCIGGTVFEDNDSNNGSSSGNIAYISPSQFNARLRSIEEDYPPMAWKGMMNLAGSHDTNRILFLLKKVNNDSASAAAQRLKESWIFAFTYAGAPTLYYGDEIGLTQDGMWASGSYQDDPYNRVPFPWDDTPGDNSANTGLQDFARIMSSTRLAYRALQDGDVQHGILIDDTNKLYGFARTNATQTALIVLNRSGANHPATLTNLNTAPFNLPDGTVMIDPVNSLAEYTVTGGAITVTVNATWGVVLLEKTEVDTPALPSGLTAQVNGDQVTLKWSPVAEDTGSGHELAVRYTLHRNMAPEFGTYATVFPPVYGSSDGKISFTSSIQPGESYYYIICAHNAAGKRNCTAAFQAVYGLTLSKQGAGTVSSSPAGIDCGPTCASQAASYTNGDIVILTAAPESTASFAGWGGACSGTALTCPVTMSAARSVTATFITYQVMLPIVTR